MKKLSFLYLLAISVTASNAATILSTDFSDVTGSGTDTATFSWDTVSGVDAPASNLVISGETGSPVLYASSTTNEEMNINYQWNLTGRNFLSTTIEDLSLAAGVDSIDLTNFSVLFDTRANGGGNQAGGKNNIEVEVEIIGSISGSLGSNSVTQSEPGSTGGLTYDIDLSSLASLNSSETYDVILTVNVADSGGAHYGAIDTIVLDGDITFVPEPSSVVLLGLGGLGLVLRRRRN